MENSETLIVNSSEFPLSDDIKNRINGISVQPGGTAIGDEAFSDCPNLTKMEFVDTVTEIGKASFRGCSSLTELTLPNNIKKIGESAFQGCSSLTHISIPKWVTDIYDRTFQDCTSLKEVTIPDRVTKIWESAFQGCSSLTHISIPKRVTNICDKAFSGCTNLTEVEFPDTVTEIGEAAFQGCTSLTELTIPDSVTEIGPSAFEGCSNLRRITMSKNVTVINDQTFRGCTSLEDAPIFDGIKFIGREAFADCSSLTRLTIPKSVVIITERTFANCTSLREVTFKEPALICSDGVFQDCTDLTSIVMPSWLYVPCAFFRGCKNLSHVELPNTIMMINEQAFCGCAKLSHLKLPPLLLKIGSMAFSGAGCIDQIIHDHPDLIPHLDPNAISMKEFIERVRKYPEFADAFDLVSNTSGHEWAELLISLPSLAYRCPWEKLTADGLAELLTAQPQLAGYCDWQKFSRKEQRKIFRNHSILQACFRSECLPPAETLKDLLAVSYSADNRKFRGLFSGDVSDAATYLIYKNMDQENAKYFLKKQFENENWDFLEELCEISPEELTAVPGGKMMPFYIALLCPDRIFYKFFSQVDTRLRDHAGNSLLFPAAVHDLCEGGGNRYDYFVEHGCDPDEKNPAGFSCREFVRSMNNSNKKG